MVSHISFACFSASFLYLLPQILSIYLYIYLARSLMHITEDHVWHRVWADCPFGGRFAHAISPAISLGFATDPLFEHMHAPSSSSSSSFSSSVSSSTYSSLSSSFASSTYSSSSSFSPSAGPTSHSSFVLTSASLHALNSAAAAPKPAAFALISGGSDRDAVFGCVFS